MLEEGQNQREIAQKRIKCQEIMEKGEDDGINALPDCLLLEILSRLPSTKDAIITSTLAKRWEHVWTWVPSLIFKHSNHSFENPNSSSDFASLVDKTLTQCRQSKLKKFQVHTFYDIRLESQFNNWIHYAISCNVEELNLKFLGREPEFLLDQFLFINSCFTDVRLAGCKLNPTGAISWENLRSLCISNVNLDEDLIVKILSGSPLLETLVVEYCYGHGRPNIISDDESESESESEASDIIKIRMSAPTSLSPTQCPKLKKFKVYTSYDVHFQSQLNIWIHYAIRCNVKELDLEFWNTDSEYEFILGQIVFTSSCFTELRVDGCMLNPVGEISWKSLRSLCISGYQSLDEDLIENILSGSPVLETLILDNCYGYNRLDITSKSVKNLVLRGYEDFSYVESEADIIEINAPNILSLTIDHDVSLCKLLLLNVSSLVKAHLDYTCTKLTTPNEVEEEVLKGCIMNLRHVTEVELGYLCSKAISCLQAKGFVLPSNVKLSGVR
ncbi:putative F-box/LRR-repeat protein At3g28410 [Lactuca sativa]|uniref:At1g61320/AtMIF1 LRR domain-containing protein n=1 Tax=Lactuca sativa TaxID=4236 RepID=A0A9R1WSE8_LACSA|nr:putative F-box/LRR-repeat protein At3g28410 [Lactuca sativa]KAJ0186546.1 hypothetical protein LSAT_V11C900458850 [Lactuca sativa]